VCKPEAVASTAQAEFGYDEKNLIGGGGSCALALLLIAIPCRKLKDSRIRKLTVANC